MFRGESEAADHQDREKPAACRGAEAPERRMAGRLFARPRDSDLILSHFVQKELLFKILVIGDYGVGECPRETAAAPITREIRRPPERIGERGGRERGTGSLLTGVRAHLSGGI